MYEKPTENREARTQLDAQRDNRLEIMVKMEFISN